MPKELEDKLKREAKKKFPNDKERQDRYVYGTLNREKQDAAHRKKRRKKA